MRSAEAIFQLRQTLKNFSVIPGQALGPVAKTIISEALQCTEIIDAELCPGPIVDAVIDACRARGFGRQWVKGTVSEIVESVQLLAAPPIPLEPMVEDVVHAMIRKVHGRGKFALFVPYLTANQTMLDDIEGRLFAPPAPLPPDPCGNILVALHELAVAVQTPIPPHAPAASAAGKCLDLVASLKKHAEKTDAQQKQAFAQLEQRAQNFALERDAARRTMDDQAEAMAKLEEGYGNLESEVVERERAIVHLVLERAQ